MTSKELRKVLWQSALSFAEKREFAKDKSHESAIIFSTVEHNFHPESFDNINKKKHLAWKARTSKPHPNIPGVKEMQSSNSSDALLMNIFCHPSINEWQGVRKLMRTDIESISFGYSADVQLCDGKADSTEIDMSLPDSFCEAKLTEPNFTKKRPLVVENYAGLKKVFHIEALPRKGDDYDNYQIIRNLLASVQHNRKHYLFCDERRPDLARRYMETVSCLREVRWRLNCRIIFWQEIVAACGASLREWIEEKYGMCNKINAVVPKNRPVD